MPQSVSLFYHASIALVIVKLLFTAPLPISYLYVSYLYVSQLCTSAMGWGGEMVGRQGRAAMGLPL